MPLKSSVNLYVSHSYSTAAKFADDTIAISAKVEAFCRDVCTFLNGPILGKVLIIALTRWDHDNAFCNPFCCGLFDIAFSSAGLEKASVVFTHCLICSYPSILIPCSTSSLNIHSNPLKRLKNLA